MALWVPESGLQDHFLIQITPQKSLWTPFLALKSGFRPFCFFWVSWGECKKALIDFDVWNSRLLLAFCWPILAVADFYLHSSDFLLAFTDLLMTFY